MKRLLLRAGIRAVLYWCIFWIMFPLIVTVQGYFIEEYIVPEAYISSINTPYYSNAWTKQVLEEFNAMADGKAVLFAPHVIDRPITISESEDLEVIPKFLRDPNYNLVTIGLAEREVMSCKITLKTNLDYATFRTTLIHEYLHCMGYDHVEGDPNDLMAPVDGNISEENIRKYAKDVARRIWKNSKN